VMLAVSWFGNWLRFRGRLETTRWFLWYAFLAFPSGFVAVLTGWITAEVGRQPWVVFGLFCTADAKTPTLAGPQVLATLIGYVAVYVHVRVWCPLHLPLAARRADRGRAEARTGNRKTPDDGGRPGRNGHRTRSGRGVR